MKLYIDWVKEIIGTEGEGENTQSKMEWRRVTGFICEDSEDKKLISKFLGMITMNKDSKIPRFIGKTY